MNSTRPHRFVGIQLEQKILHNFRVHWELIIFTVMILQLRADDPPQLRDPSIHHLCWRQKNAKNALNTSPLFCPWLWGDHSHPVTGQRYFYTASCLNIFEKTLFIVPHSFNSSWDLAAHIFSLQHQTAPLDDSYITWPCVHWTSLFFALFWKQIPDQLYLINTMRQFKIPLYSWYP